MSDWKRQWADTMQAGIINDAISKYHTNQPERLQTCASPSTLTDCPRVVWLRYKKKIAPPIPIGWGKLQRFMLGRQLESLIAMQLKESGNLLWWWKDDVAGESDKFVMGEGETRIEGTPDLLLKNDTQVLISDAKTSMAKSFGYVPLDPAEAFKDWFWFGKQLQVEAYYLLSHKNKAWFQPQLRAWKDIEKELNNTKPGGVIELGGGRQLPLPEACHLFSYALDNGVNYREFTWGPSKETASKIIYYATRWNRAYASETIPDCTCDEGDGAPRKFCYYVQEQETTKTGAKIGIRCCGEELLDKLNKEN